ncbi:hypothetical protein MHYMCMPSP_00079 [Hyalomma marginatum]|uniref:Methylated-DNA--protein-cysteine methyltransferase n=1 Tax=Hyalomma marginatum TaxID=34627 RepID=A0A8S4C522_9ACAR|nr:hypothetical protein MHYMCMPSP_00079 [Hyalomma marginatum]CAG7597766.1 hypothetical protein MHYMCMPASI_00964 [Hyalomma marginatum]
MNFSVLRSRADMGTIKLKEHYKTLKTSWIRISSMQVISSEDSIYLLEFAEKRGLEGEIARLKLREKATIVAGITCAMKAIEAELKAYFEGTLKNFETPLYISGSPFQKKVWEELIGIPYGQTRTYAAQAEAIGKKSSYRAVANANRANQIAIVIPCHRIINSNGKLGGYSGGESRKQWLLEHERRYISSK